MVTFCGITAFTSTVIRGKDQSFCVHAMSRKVDSTALCSHQKKKYRRGLSSVRKDFFLTNRTSPGFVVLQASHRSRRGRWEHALCLSVPPAQLQANIQITNRSCIYNPGRSLLLLCKHLSQLFKERTVSSTRSSISELLSTHCFFPPRKEQIIPSVIHQKKNE